MKTPPLSPRRRRLRTTVIVLTIASIVAAAIGTVIYFKTRPTQYRPDEQPEDITSSLARNLPPDAPQPRFVDVTATAGLRSFRNFIGDRTSQLPEDIGPGLAWGDFDNDADDDLFLVSGGGPLNVPPEKLAPCALYENLGDGTFRKMEGFPELHIHGNGAAWADYDGDGFLDLVVAGYNTLLLFHNEGGMRFVREERLPNPKGFWSGASWGDYDNDRAPDLYICGYVRYVENEADIMRGSSQLGTFVPFTLNPASYAGETNLLFHNNGDGTFTEVGGQLKVQNPEGRSLAGLWHDFDDDGWLDLYVANDISDNVFYHNLGGRFEDLSHPALVADYRSAMGLAAGDFDRDGDDDLFVVHWVAQENGLYENLWADFNYKLKKQNGKAPLRFMDIADMKGLGQMSLPYVGWGTEFADFDGDGWLDLAVANGNTLEFPGASPKKLQPQETFLLWNRRSEHFHNLAPLNRSLSEQHNNRGVAVADYDNDGAVDLAIAQLGEGVQLLRNEMQNGHWLKLRLRSLTRTGKPVGFAHGTKVIAHLGGAALRRTVSSVSYLSQSSHTLHFGLGPATHVDRLEVRWQCGATNFFDGIEANATYEIVEGEKTVRRLSNPSSLQTAIPNREQLSEFWFKQRAAMSAMKVEKNNAKAISLFREALALNQKHEDSRYYLGICLASQNDVVGALAELAELQRLNPQSHRAWQQWGVFKALCAKSESDLVAAEQALERAHKLNPEETGALLVLGEVALLRGDSSLAHDRLAAVCRMNPKAVAGFFLRGFIAWKAGNDAAARTFLADARTALGKDWQPKGTTSEGDVKQKQHVETTPLTRFWERWDGSAAPESSFAALDVYLGERRAGVHASHFP